MTVVSFEKGNVRIAVEKLATGYHVIRHSGNASFSFPYNGLRDALECYDWHVLQFKGKDADNGV